MVTYALSVALAIRVGNELGAGEQVSKCVRYAHMNACADRAGQAMTCLGSAHIPGTYVVLASPLQKVALSFLHV